MSAGHSKKSHSSGLSILGSIRYGVGYAERLVRNCGSQIMWTYGKGKELYNYFISTQFSTTPDLGVRICIGSIIFILLIPILIGLLFWAFIKSI